MNSPLDCPHLAISIRMYVFGTEESGLADVGLFASLICVVYYGNKHCRLAGLVNNTMQCAIHKLIPLAATWSKD